MNAVAAAVIRAPQIDFKTRQATLKKQWNLKTDPNLPSKIFSQSKTDSL